MEPLDGRPPLEVRVRRFAERMKPQVTDPGLKWSKGLHSEQREIKLLSDVFSYSG